MTWELGLILLLSLVTWGILLLAWWTLQTVRADLDQAQAQLEQVQKLLNVWDRPTSLSVQGMEPGSTFLPTEAEAAQLEARLSAESRQRTPTPGWKRTSKRTTGSPTAASP